MVVEEETAKGKLEIEKEFLQNEVMTALATAETIRYSSMTSVINRGCPGVMIVTKGGTFLVTVSKVSNAISA